MFKLFAKSFLYRNPTSASGRWNIVYLNHHKWVYISPIVIHVTNTVIHTYSQCIPQSYIYSENKCRQTASISYPHCSPATCDEILISSVTGNNSSFLIQYTYTAFSTSFITLYWSSDSVWPIRGMWSVEEVKYVFMNIIIKIG